MSSINNITGDTLISKIGDSEAYSRNFDAIFGKNKHNEIQKRVIKEIAEITFVRMDEIYPDSELEANLDFDELDNIQLLINLEGAFSCDISDDDAANFKTVQNIIDHMEKMVNEGNAK